MKIEEEQSLGKWNSPCQAPTEGRACYHFAGKSRSVSLKEDSGRGKDGERRVERSGHAVPWRPCAGVWIIS